MISFFLNQVILPNTSSIVARVWDIHKAQYNKIVTMVVKTGQLSGTCSVQRFQFQKRHMAASAVEKNNKYWLSYINVSSYS